MSVLLGVQEEAYRQKSFPMRAMRGDLLANEWEARQGWNQQKSGGGMMQSPPHSNSIEQRVLGAMMLNPEAVARAVSIIKRQSFYRGRHREIFDAILRLYRQGLGTDVPSVVRELERKGSLEQCGGAAYLADLASSVGTTAHVEENARELADLLERRVLIVAAQKAARHYENITVPVKSTSHDLQASILQIASAQRDRHTTLAAQVFAERGIEKYNQRQSSVKVYSTGFPLRPHTGHAPLDAALRGGFTSGRLFTVAGYPGCGKTALLAQIAYLMTDDPETPVAVLVLEDSPQSFVERIQAQIASIPMSWSQTVAIDEEATRVDRLKRLSDGIPLFVGRRLYVGSIASPTLENVTIWMETMRHLWGCEVFVIDHFGMIVLKKTERPLDAREEIVAGLAGYAADRDVCVIIAHHLTRRDRADIRDQRVWRPTYESLSRTSNFERLCYGVLYLLNPFAEMTRARAEECIDPLTSRLWPPNKAVLGSMKGKNIPAFEIGLEWQGEIGRFIPWSKDEEEYIPARDDEDRPFQ